MVARILSVVLLAVFPSLAANSWDNGIPLFFIGNTGQAPPEVRFMAKGSGLTAYFLRDEAVFRTSRSLVHVRWEGANSNVRIEGASPLAGQVNFFTGSVENWRAGVPTYGAVAYRDLYTGIDMVYGGSGRSLKSEYLVAPGADPAQIRVQYQGAGEVRIGRNGELAIAVQGETLREQAPEAYQIRGGKRIPVKARFQARANGAIGFAMGAYDRSLPLVIDPVLSYSTYLGGSGADAANALAVDSTGAAYVAGFTSSYDLPTLNPEQAANGGGNDVFVAKLTASGSALVYCTYLGGTGDDRAFGIAVDSTGAAYVTGWTQSANFPVRNALQASLAGGQNAFMVKLTAAGNGLVYSTFLGGNGSDSGNGIAVDSSGNAYAAGDTTSTNFPVSASAFQKTYHGGQDAFAIKLNASGSALTYSTYLGGGNTDHGAAIAVDAGGNALITGSTTSTNFPLANAFQGTIGGGQNAFVTRLNPAGTALLFSTYLGGSGGSAGYPEGGQGIALDSQANAYVAGVTSSTNFPLLNPAQSTLDGWTDAFIAKISASGALIYSTYLGGSGMDSANAIAVDSSGNAYIAGYTYSLDLPVFGAIQPAVGGLGSTDAFVGKLNPSGNSLTFLTYLGGSASDTATSVAVDSSGSVYVAGWTLSSNFPVLNPLESQNAGNYGAFVAKYVFNVGPVNVGVTPNSGGGPAQMFSFQYSDANGASDLTAAGALFNTSSSLTSACAVIYSRAQNTLALLTDAGAQPAALLNPGSGTQQNSQCVLNGGGSSVSLTGNLLTLNLAITFQGAFSGSKTVYMQASNPYQITAWQAEGAWQALAALTLSVTPASGNAAQQIFNFQATDPLGVADLTSVGLLFNSSTNTSSACAVIYNRAQNTLALLTDAGAPPSSSLTPGSGTQQNSQCILNGSASSVFGSGNLLGLNLALSFQPAFSGAKTVYAEAIGASQTVTWQQAGTWISPPAVTLSVTPSSGAGSSQQFSFLAADSLAASDLTTVGVLFNSTAIASAACAVIYNSSQNTLALLTDAGAQPAGSITPGSGTQRNSQCVLNGAGSSVSASGATLTLNLTLTFLSAFAGTKNIYMEAANPYETVNWQVEGVWVAASALSATVSPASGNGTQQTFNLEFTDPLGAADLTTVGLLFNSSASTTGACAILYNRAQNTLALLTDSGAQPASSLTPGSGSQQNSQCALSATASSAAVAGNVLALNLAVVFLPPFSGTKSVYAEAIGASQTLNWQQEGIWTSPPVVTMAVTPSSGGGSQQKFVLQVTDSLAGTDLTSIGFLIDATASTAGACAVIYNATQNTLSLLTDAGAQPSGAIAPGSGSQQNSQCSLNGAGSSVSKSGNTLTLNLALTFQPAFLGSKNIYMEAANPYETVNWQLEGTWVSAPALALSVTPSSGNATQQTFNLQVSDSLGAADLTMVGILFNTAPSAVSACAVTYNRAQNTLMLLTDSGAAPASSLTPGSGTQQNSQCVLNGAASSASLAGNVLTLNLALSFQAAFYGTKNIYAEAASSSQAANWQLEGAWAVLPVLAGSVSPVSGSGPQQTFNFQFTDSAGAADLSTAGALINATAATNGACAVIYNRSQNTLALLTDSGGQPASSITPGSGAQQNSQCILNGAASIASVSGNALTLTLSLSFLTAFDGVKNVYVDAADSSTAIAWQLAGSFAATPVGPSVVSVTPASGSGSQQVFNLRYSDSAGVSDLTTVWAYFTSNFSGSGANTCMIYYARSSNQLYVLNNAASAWSAGATPGTAVTLSNSQCSINVAAATVTSTGDTLTVNLPMTFSTGYAGTQNIYMFAAGSSANSGWQTMGSWTVPGSASSASLSVSSTHSGNFTQGQSGATYTVTVSNASGAGASSGTVTVTDTLPSGLTLTSMAGTGWSCTGNTCTRSDALNAGSSYPAITVTVNVGGSASSPEVNTVSVSGGGSASASGTDSTTIASGSTAATVSAVSVTPSSGSGASQTFALNYSDSAGVSDLTTVWAYFTSNFSGSGANTCMIYYARSSNQLYLLNNAASAWSAGATPGTAVTLSNSQCSINVGAATVTSTGNTLTVNLPMTFSTGYAGTQNIYMFAAGSSANSGWQTMGSWTVPGSASSASLSVSSTHSGNFTQGQSGATYTVTVSNASGAGASSGTVTVTDTLPSGLTLTSMAGTGWSCTGNTCTRSDALNAGSSYPAITVTVNVGGSASSPEVNSVSVSGGGSASASGTDSTTIASGSTAATVSAVSVTPSSGSGASQTFALNYSDSARVSDLTTVWAYFTSNFSGSGANTCMIYYARSSNQLYVLNNAASAWSAGATPGTAVTLSNSQCSINVGAATVTSTGNTLTVNLPMTFSTGYAGTRNIYMFAAGSSANSGWQTMGSWTVPGSASSASLSVSSTHSGNFTQGQSGATYTVTVSNASGAGATSGTVTVTDTVPSGLTLTSMAGTGWSCTGNTCTRSDALNAGSSYPAITVTVNVGGSASSPQVNTVSVSGGGSASGSGTDSTTIASGSTAATVSAVSVTPSSGSGASQTFALNYSDSAGVSDLTTVWAYFGSSLEGSTNLCLMYYNWAQNTIFVLNDNGASYTALAPGTAMTTGNSQCSVNLGAAAVVASGTNLILTLPVSFTSAYTGANGIFMFAASAGGAVSGWQQAGTWTVN